MVGNSEHRNKSSGGEDGLPMYGERNLRSKKFERKEKRPDATFQYAVKFHQIPLIDNSITRIRLYTITDGDDSLCNTHIHYAIHCPKGRCWDPHSRDSGASLTKMFVVRSIIHHCKNMRRNTPHFLSPNIRT